MTTAPEHKQPEEKTGQPPHHFTWQSADGLTLAGVDWQVTSSISPDPKIPVLCLPGLSRNTRDFNDIATFLHASGHRVIALDYRGRGRSAWDSDWQNYTLPVEAGDIDAAITQLQLDSFAVLGTSRGGLHALTMGLRYLADRMKGIIFNDIGPEIEMSSLHRIAATLGQNMSNPSFEAVAQNLNHALGVQFPEFEPADWMKLARQLASEKDGKVVMDYDPELANQLAGLDDAAPPPDLWPLYEQLADRAVLVVRGEKTDLISIATAERMIANHPRAALVTVPGQGHAPVLWERHIHQSVAAFLKDL